MVSRACNLSVNYTLQPMFVVKLQQMLKILWKWFINSTIKHYLDGLYKVAICLHNEYCLMNSMVGKACMFADSQTTIKYNFTSINVDYYPTFNDNYSKWLSL